MAPHLSPAPSSPVTIRLRGVQVLKSSDSSSGYSRRGDLLLRQRRTAEARANFLRALQLDPNIPGAAKAREMKLAGYGAAYAAAPTPGEVIRINSPITTMPVVNSSVASVAISTIGSAYTSRMTNS